MGTHTNGNVAVGTLYGHVNFGTNVHEGVVERDISYIQTPTNIANSSFVAAGDTRENKVIFGNGNDIDVSNPNRPSVNGVNLDHANSYEIYQDKGTNKYIDVENYLDDFLSKKSSNLTQEDPQAKINNSEFPDQNQRTVNLEKFERTEDNKIVIDLDPSVLTSGTPLTIYGLSQDAGGTNIIFNVDTKGQDPYDVTSQIKLIYNDGSTNNNVERPNQETEYFDDNHLLWNIYDSTASDTLYTGNAIIDRPFQGSVLAPKATVTVNQNLDGNIAADKVYVNAETHRWDFQDDSKTPTEYERPIVLPGEAVIPDIDEEENEGGNIEYPDEEEEEDGIDPDTGGLEEGNEPNPDPDEGDNGGNTTDPDEGDNGGNTTDPDAGDNGGSTVDPEEPNKGDENETTDEEESGDNSNLIIHGGSEGKEESEKEAEETSDSNLSEGVLPDVVGNDNDESQTPNNVNTATSNESGTLPQTGETSGVLATIGGLILILLGFVLKTIGIKKE